MVSWRVCRNDISMGTPGVYFALVLISVLPPPPPNPLPAMAVLKASGLATMSSTCNLNGPASRSPLSGIPSSPWTAACWRVCSIASWPCVRFMRSWVVLGRKTWTEPVCCPCLSLTPISVLGPHPTGCLAREPMLLILKGPDCPPPSPAFPRNPWLLPSSITT